MKIESERLILTKKDIAILVLGLWAVLSMPDMSRKQAGITRREKKRAIKILAQISLEASTLASDTESYEAITEAWEWGAYHSPEARKCLPEVREMIKKLNG